MKIFDGNVFIGKRMQEFKFNDIPVIGLSIFVDEKEVAMGFIGKVLRQIPHLKDFVITSTNYYFDTFVIRLTAPPETNTKED